MAGVIFAPLAAGTFISTAILAPFIPSLLLFGMPLILSFSTVFFLWLNSLNFWFSSKEFIYQPWWNISLAILSILGIIPSFILVLPGFIGTIITLPLLPIFYGLEILSVVAFIYYIIYDPNMKILTPIIYWLYCVFG